MRGSSTTAGHRVTRRIIRCTPRHIPRLLDYLSEHNPRPEHHIGYLGVSPDDIRESVLAADSRSDCAFRLALEGNRLVGAMGIDFDEAIGRAWLYGPVVTAEAWTQTADALYEAVRLIVPAGVEEHEMFVDAENANCRAFAERHGLAFVKEMAIFTIMPERLAALPKDSAERWAMVRPWADEFTDWFVALHERLFPSSNYTLGYMLGERDKGAAFLVLLDGERPAGYFFGRVEPESGQAYVDLLGVDEAYRGRGIGRRLMHAGLAHLRAMPGLQQVNLTVDAANHPAQQLYFSLGFEKERDMVAYRGGRKN